MPPLRPRGQRRIERTNDRRVKLERARTVRWWLAWQLSQLDQQIAKWEREEAAAKAARPLPPPAEWLLQRGIGQGRPPVAIHAGSCRLAGSHAAPLSEAEARRALGNGLPGCEVCDPEAVLGYDPA
ncbi:DUF6233 domain-containing protein [Streptomyces sp. NPDC053367]|uniref:DUF6233 domain-containing protein n=1 Tax=Streptomyces sp. NPDC053367 TaxID=3365700 RepID=UPI0037D42DCE